MRVAVTILITIAVVLVTSTASAAESQPHRIKLCDPSEVRALVSRFIAAFNAGDARRLDRIFARKPYFRWYSTDAPGQRFLPIAADRASLLRYFATRHRLGEHLTLRSVQVNGNTVASGREWKTYGNFEHTLVREASDLLPTRYEGKGALHCYRNRPDQLIVWSMGRAWTQSPPPSP